MKKILPILIMVLIVTATILTGCGNNVDTPNKNDLVVGNGGMNVVKGDFVYYVNGYESYNDIESTHNNKNGKVDTSAIYVAKIVDGEYTNKTKLVSKVGGFEYSDLYIFDDKLYFLTPSAKKDDTGKVRNDIISLFSVNLDGTKLSEIYTPSQYTSGKFSMVNINNNIYAIVYDGTNIIKVDISNKNNATTIAENVTSAILPKDASCFSEEDQNVIDDSIKSMIYYTRSKTEGEGSGFGGNIIEKYNLKGNQKTTVESFSSSEVELTNIAGNRLYYKKDSNYYSLDLSSGEDVRRSYDTYDNFMPLGNDENNNDLGILIKYNSSLYLQSSNNIVLPSEKFLDENVTILFNYFDLIFVKNSNGDILTISAKDKNQTIIYLASEDIVMSQDKFDFDGRYLTFFANLKDETKQKLFVVDTYLSIGGTTGAKNLGE